MQHIDIILFALFVIAIFACAIAMFKYVKLSKDYYYNTIGDNDGLYDFITIKDTIINVDHIINIKRVRDIKTETCKILIELDDNDELIIFNFDDDIECNYAFEQIHDRLDSANIAID